MTKKEAQKQIKLFFPLILEAIHENIPKYTKSPKFKIVNNTNQLKKEYHKRVNPCYKFEDVVYAPEKTVGVAISGKQFIIFNTNPIRYTDHVLNGICHELWHCIMPSIIPYTYSWQSIYQKPYRNPMKLAKYHWHIKNYMFSNFSAEATNSFISQFFRSISTENDDEIFAYLFEMACVDDFFYAHEIMNDYFNIDTRKIYKSIKKN